MEIDLEKAVQYLLRVDCAKKTNKPERELDKEDLEHWIWFNNLEKDNDT